MIEVRQKLFLVDDDAVTVDGALDGDAEESVVVNVLGVGTGGGGAQRTAAGGSQGDEGGKTEDEKLFHVSILLRLEF